MGIVNGCPFLIRVNLGILADMITQTSNEMKEKWGQWAYGITAFQELPKDGQLYELIVDGRSIHEKAVAITITNAGNVGKKGYSFLPDISVTAGCLDLIILDDADFLSLLKVTGSILMQKDSDILRHYRAKEIILRGKDSLDFLCDDITQYTAELNISISPSSLKIAFPNKPVDDEKD